MITWCVMDPGLIDDVRVRGQKGFTLIEMMIVVAVIAVLAILVVPQFFKESVRTKAKTEVSAMFAELSAKEEQYKVDTGAYANIAECPTTTSPAGVDKTTCESTADWVTLRINPSLQILRCKYQVFAGLATDTASPPVGFTFTSPTTTGWYYMLATCDGDGNATTNATFLASSVNTQIQPLNEGQ